MVRRAVRGQTAVHEHSGGGGGALRVAATLRGRAPDLLAVVAAVLVGAAAGAALVGAVRAPGATWLMAAAAIVGATAAGTVAFAFGWVRRVLIAAIVFDTTLQIDTHMLYREGPAAFGALGGLNLSLTTVCIAALYALWIADLLARPGLAPRPRTAPALAAVLYLVALVIATPFAADPTLASFEVWLIAHMVLLFSYLVANVRTRGDVVFIVTVFLASLAVQGAVTVLSGLAQRTVEVAGVSNAIDASYQRGTVWRSGGTIGSPNAAAGFFAMLLGPALAIVLTQRRSALTMLATSALALGFAGLVVTRSRGGWLAALVSLAVIIAVLLVERALARRTVRRLVLIGIVLAPLTVPLVLGRVQSDDAGAAASRGPLNAIALRMIVDAPLVGVGPNNFAVEFPRYVPPELAREWLYTVHNKYLLVWSEGGVLAFAAFLAVLATGLSMARRAFRMHDGLLAVVALGFGAALVGQMIHMGFDLFNARPNVQTLWLVIALVAAIAVNAESMRASARHLGAKS